MVQGTAVCACAAGHGGMRCERRESARAPAPAQAHDNDTPPRRVAGADERELHPPREYSHTFCCCAVVLRAGPQLRRRGVFRRQAFARQVNLK